MNKLAFQILSKILSHPGIDRKTLVSESQREYPASPHEIAIVIADLKNESLIIEGDQGFRPAHDRAEYYQKMRPFSDDEVLDLMIEYLNKPGGSPSVISNLNSDLKLYLNREDSEYYEALLRQNNFVMTTYPSGQTMPTFFISDKGKINLRKYGRYLEYVEAQKPKETPEDKVLKYLSSTPGMLYDPNEVLKECGIESSLIFSILAILEDKVNKVYAIGNSLPIGISITDEGLRYLHSGEKPSVANISNYVLHDHSNHTYGNNSPIVGGHLTKGNKNIVNSGDNVNQTVHVTIKGHWESLEKTLLENGVDEGDVEELKSIVGSEEPDGKNLGPKALSWIMKVSLKALQGVGKIATGVGSNLIAAWIKNYYGIHS